MPKEVKKTKKQLEEEEKLRKEEEKRAKLAAIEEKKREELRLKQIEEERLRKIEEERLAQEEIQRLELEEQGMLGWNRKLDEELLKSLSKTNNNEDWNNYSSCKPGYINARKEKDINGFIYEFKERCDSNFIMNYELKEKNFSEELLSFDMSQSNIENLFRLYLESRATYDTKLMLYSLEYINAIQNLERMKIESLTKYFAENFEHNRKIIVDELRRTEKNFEEYDYVAEWVNKTNTFRYGYWINSPDTKVRDVTTKFKHILLRIITMPRYFTQNASIIRFYWTENDIRELMLEKAFCPYITLSGTFFVDLVTYPQKSSKYKNWDYRDVLGDKYKYLLSENKDTYSQNIKFRFQIQLPQKIFVSDFDSIYVGVFNAEKKTWSFIKNKEVISKENKTIAFWSTDVGIFSLLTERNTYFPYRGWRLRCVDKHVAILNLDTPVVRFTFEITSTYVKLIQNVNNVNVKLKDPIEPEFAHLLNKEMKYDSLLVELRKCGVILYPATQDLEYSGLQVKDFEAQNRAITDIIMACRYYSIRTHPQNLQINQNIVLAKFKPNPEFDKEFLDDEEQDWFDVAWYPNKCVIGKVKEVEGELKFIKSEDINESRTHFHLLIQDLKQDEILHEIEDYEDEKNSKTRPISNFLINLRCFLRLLNITNFAPYCEKLKHMNTEQAEGNEGQENKDLSNQVNPQANVTGGLNSGSDANANATASAVPESGNASATPGVAGGEATSS